MVISYKDFEIEVKDEQAYSVKYAGNATNYQFEYARGKLIENKIFPLNKRGIIIKNVELQKEIASAILCENGGRSGISKDILALEADRLWVCVGDAMYCMVIPTLEVAWFCHLDYGTNHSIHHFQEDFVVHANLGLVRITKQGEIKWKFSGGIGVFVPGDGRLTIFDHHIELIDGNEKKFTINEFGEEMN